MAYKKKPKSIKITIRENKPKNSKNSMSSTNSRALRKEEIELFKTHSKHHSKKHIEVMKKFIRSGKGCFSDSHKHAMKVAGK